MSATGFDNNEIKGTGIEKFKGKKNEVYVGGFVGLDPKALIHAKKVHSGKVGDSFFSCTCKTTDPSDPQDCCTASWKGNEAKWKVGGALIIYTLNVEDELTNYKVLPWIFSDRQFSALKVINKDFPLHEHDLALTCTDDTFQNFTVSPKKSCLWRKLPEQHKAKVLAQAEQVMKKIPNLIARDLSLAEIRETLGLTSAADTASSLDLGDLGSL